MSGFIDAAVGLAKKTPWGAVIGAGIGLAGSIYGQNKARKAQNQYDAYALKSIQAQKDTIKGRYTDLEGTFNRRNSQDYLDTESAKAMQKRFADYAKNTRENIQGQAIAAGATTEAVVAQQKNLSDSYNTMLDSLADKSTQYKLNNQNAYDMRKLGLQQSEDNLTQAEQNMNLNRLNAKVSSANNLSSGFLAAGTGITNAWAEGAFKK